MSENEAIQRIFNRIEPLGFGRRDARDLFEKAFSTEKIEAEKTLAAWLERLESGEPIQYVLQEAWFDGMAFFVDPRVLIPRQETEELAHFALKMIEKQPSPRILDIGTGSACLPIFFKKRRPDADVFALDVSHDALVVARKNVEKWVAGKVQFFEIDILKTENWPALPDSNDLIVSNPPYILEAEKSVMGPDVLAHEPHLALFAPTEKPLIFYEKIVEFALQKLKKGGSLAFECNEFNAAEVAQLLDNQGFMNVRLEKDIPGKERFVLAEKA